MSQRTWLARRRRFLRTTPGLLSALAAALVVLGLTSGLVAVVTIQSRAALVADVSARSGQLSRQAQDIYRSLSDADATAASAFLVGGVEPTALRTRYLNDVAQATATLAVASRTAGTASAPALDVLISQLPTYTGLIETARAHNRQGLPLAAAYLREASGLMRATLLPAAAQLYDVETGHLTVAQDGAAAWPWATAAFGLLVLAGLVGLQIHLTRRTRRLINRGLALATLAATASLAWTVIAVSGAAGHVEDGRRDGSAQVQLLAEARIAALQARADEALTLIARGDGKAFEDDFTATAKRLVGEDGSSGLLGRAREQAEGTAGAATVDTALTQVRQWLAIHKKLRELDDSSQYDAAVALATGGAPDTSASVFSLLDATLQRGIDDGGGRFDEAAGQAGGALRGADVAATVAAIALALAGALGIYQRVAEYR